MQVERLVMQRRLSRSAVNPFHCTAVSALIIIITPSVNAWKKLPPSLYFMMTHAHLMYIVNLANVADGVGKLKRNK